MRGLFGEDSITRIDSLFSSYFGVLFSLCRLENFKKVFLKIPGVSIISNELIPALRLVAIGNIGHIDTLYLVRSVHKKRVKIPGILDEILDPDWSYNLGLLRDDFNRIKSLNQKSTKLEPTFETIITKYFSRSIKIKHGNIFLSKIKKLLYIFSNFNKIYIFKGVKNPFYLGSKELKIVLDIVEGKKKI